MVALGRMKDTPIRLAVRGTDLQGFAVQAGRSLDGTKINVVVSNYEVPASLRGTRPDGDVIPAYNLHLLPRRELDYRDNAGFELEVSGLRTDVPLKVEGYRINDTRDLRLLNTTTAEGPVIELGAPLRAPGIELVVIEQID